MERKFQLPIKDKGHKYGYKIGHSAGYRDGLKGHKYDDKAPADKPKPKGGEYFDATGYAQGYKTGYKSGYKSGYGSGSEHYHQKSWKRHYGSKKYFK